MSRDDPIPSFEAVRRELDRRAGEQERKGSASDTKAGLILGFDGIIVGLTFDRDEWLSLVGQSLATVSALVALLSMWPRVAAAIDVRQLRDRYLAEDLARTQLAVLDSRIHLFQQDERRINLKIQCLRIAVVLLAIAVLALGTAAILYEDGVGKGLGYG